MKQTPQMKGSINQDKVQKYEKTLSARTTDKYIDDEPKQSLAPMFLKCLQKTDPNCNQLTVKSMPLERIRKEMKAIRDTMFVIHDITKRGPIPIKYNELIKIQEPIEDTLSKKTSLN